MIKTIKYSAIFVTGLIFLLAAVIFLKPSIVLNKDNLLRIINKSGSITYKDIGLNVTSEAILNKRIIFNAHDLCVKQERFNVCLPDIAIDMTLAIGFEKIRLVRISQFTANNGSLTLSPPASKTATEAEVKMPAENDPPSTTASLLLRGLELFSELSLQDIGNIDIKNWSYDVDYKGSAIKGAVDVKNSGRSVVFGINGHFKDTRVGIFAEFGEGTSIDISLNGKKAVRFVSSANAFTETMEYIQTKEIYRYKKRALAGEIKIWDVKKILDILGMHEPLAGPIDATLKLNVNYPYIDAATLDLNLVSDNISGDITYDLYQKTPTKARVKTSPKFLSYIGKRFGYEFNYRLANDKLDVVFKRDYSKLPKRIY